MNAKRLLRGELLATVVIFLALFIWPFVYSNGFLVTTLMIAGVYAVMALGVNVINGQTGQGSMGHAAFAGIGAYTAALLTAKLNWPPVAGLVLATVVAGAIGYILGRPVLKLKSFFLTMATLALVFIFQVLVINLRSFTGGTTGVAGIPWFSIGSIRFSSYKSDYYLIWVVALVVLLFARAFMRSRSGRAHAHRESLGELVHPHRMREGGHGHRIKRPRRLCRGAHTQLHRRHARSGPGGGRRDRLSCRSP